MVEDGCKALSNTSFLYTLTTFKVLLIFNDLKDFKWSQTSDKYF